VIAVLLLRSVVQSRRWRVATGGESLVGVVGEVRQEIVRGQKGMVLVSGALWSAVALDTLSVGQSVKVVGMDGLVLRVAQYESADPVRAEHL